MAYFDKIPVALYDFTIKSDKNDILLTIPDLTTRAQLYWDAATLDNMTFVAFISESDTPQSLSLQYYETPDYYWTIQYLNQKYDMLNDWPMSEVDLTNYCKKKYPNETPSYDSSSWLTINVFGNGTTPAIPAIGTTTLTLSDDENLDQILVGDYLMAEPYFPVGTKIIDIDINNLTIELDTGATATLISNTVFRAARPLIGMNSLHHYRTSSGIVADKDFIENELDEIAIPVTNYDYESEINEEKRYVLMIKPQYMNRFITEYERAFI